MHKKHLWLRMQQKAVWVGSDLTAFNGFYQCVVTEASDYTQVPTLPRHKRIPRRVDDGASNHTTPHHYRQ